MPVSELLEETKKKAKTEAKKEERPLDTILVKERFSLPILLYSTSSTYLAETTTPFIKKALERFSPEGSKEKISHQNHPDLFTYGPSGKAHLYSMEMVSSIVKEAELPPFESRYKIFLLSDIDRMLPVHANALLKTLEEKKESQIFLLTTEHFDEILPTIRSRCYHIFLPEEVAIERLSENLKTQLKQILQQALSHKYQELFASLDELEKHLQGQEESQSLFSEVCDYLFLLVRDLTSSGNEPLLALTKEELPKEPLNIPLQAFYQDLEEAKAARKVHIRIKHILEATLLKVCTLSETKSAD